MEEELEPMGKTANEDKSTISMITHDIFVVGAPESGKTALILSKITGSYAYYDSSTNDGDYYHYSSTKLNMKFRVWEGGKSINNGEENKYVNRSFILIIDATNTQESIDYLRKNFRWNNLTDRIIVVGSKFDINMSADSEKILKDFCKSNGFSAPIITSAKQGTNIDQAFEKAIKYIMEGSKEPRIIAIRRLIKLQEFFNCATVKNLPQSHKKQELIELEKLVKELVDSNDESSENDQQLLIAVNELIIQIKSAASIHRATGIAAIGNWFYNPTTLNDFKRIMGEDGQVQLQTSSRFNRASIN